MTTKRVTRYVIQNNVWKYIRDSWYYISHCIIKHETLLMYCHKHTNKTCLFVKYTYCTYIRAAADDNYDDQCITLSAIHHNIITKDSALTRTVHSMLTFCSGRDGQRPAGNTMFAPICLALPTPFESSFLMIYHAHNLHCTQFACKKRYNYVLC